MITVTFPTGVRVTYNDLCWLRHGDHNTWILCDGDPDKGGKKQVFIQASAGTIVELIRPCEVTAPPVPSPEVALDSVLQHIQSGKIKDAASWKVKELKSALATFNARSGRWRD